MWQYQNTDELYHYGIPGIRWGHRKAEYERIGDYELVPEDYVKRENRYIKKINSYARNGLKKDLKKINKETKKQVKNINRDKKTPSNIKNQLIKGVQLVDAGKRATSTALRRMYSEHLVMSIPQGESRANKKEYKKFLKINKKTYDRGYKTAMNYLENNYDLSYKSEYTDPEQTKINAEFILKKKK